MIGEISHYVILRDGQERYRGTDHSFTDAGGIRPFQEYVYQLRACTAAGCTDSSKVSLFLIYLMYNTAVKYIISVLLVVPNGIAKIMTVSKQVS